MAKCANCGVENPEDSRFCIGCGNAIEVSTESSGLKCPGCGADVPPESKFCVGCGKPMPAQGITVKQICTSCGAESGPGSKFCTGCGKDLQGASSQQATATQPEIIGPPFQRFLDNIDQKMKAASFDKIDVPPLLNLDKSFRRQKLELSKIGHVTTFCGIKCINEPATAAHLQSFSPNVFDYALRNKGYLARNAFQPLVVYPVIVASGCSEDASKFLDSYWPKHWMAYEFPIVVDVISKRLMYHQSKPLWGWMYHESIKKDADSLFTPAL